MPVRAWFPTLIYCEPLQSRGLERFNTELADECRKLRAFDRAGRKWSEQNYPGGYTSYASMNELQRFSSTFAGLERKLMGHARTFARALDMDLRGRTVRMTDCWVNIMPPTAAHSLHLHPLAFISGTYYVTTPKGCPGSSLRTPASSASWPRRRSWRRPGGRIARTSLTPPRPATSFCSKAG